MLGEGAPVVLVAHGLMQRSNDSEYRFEQDRNFYYLSGLDEPDWILVIDGDEQYLIEPERSEIEKIFNGSAQLDKISKITGINTVVESKDGWKKLREFDEVRTIVPRPQKFGTASLNPSKKLFLDKLGTKTTDITAQLLHLRTIKSLPEINAIRHAIKLTGEGFSNAISSINHLTTEAELEAVFTHLFTVKQLRHGYTPIVAGGENACTLHYIANNQKLPKNGLVLIDIGAQYNYYSADITRTISIGKVSSRQDEVQQAVKMAFDRIIKIIKPGLGLEEYQEQTNEIMNDAISGLGLGDSSDTREKYFPHAPSHGLGLDVHDALVGYNAFQPGMVLTLEPGIYIPNEAIGVRYEDDLLITDDGVENLSQDI